VTHNRGIGPPWGAFCQITLTSCLYIFTSFYSENCKQRGWCERWGFTVDVISLSSSDKTSPYATRSRTSCVTDRRLIIDLSTAPNDQKDLRVFCRTYTSVESLATKHGRTSQTAEFVDNRFTPRYNRFIYFLLQVPQTLNSSATAIKRSFQHDFNMSFKVLPLPSRISSLAVVRWRHHLVLILWLNSQQNRFCDASKCVRPYL